MIEESDLDNISNNVIVLIKADKSLLVKDVEQNTRRRTLLSFSARMLFQKFITTLQHLLVDSALCFSYSDTTKFLRIYLFMSKY